MTDPTPPFVPHRDVVAFIAVFNEADILPATLRHLTEQGVGVHIFDNWSTDGSFDIARSFLNRGVVALERFPADAPQPQWDFPAYLAHLQARMVQSSARWLIHYDADELRDSPWPGVSLIDGIRRVDSEGFNLINHRILEFHPVTGAPAFTPGADPATHFQHFRLCPGPQRHFKAFKKPPGTLDLASSGGHSPHFDNIALYPIQFLLKHYPIRSQEHGLKKVLRERLGRFKIDESQTGWHMHYADVKDDSHNFLRDPATLTRFDELAFKRAHLAEQMASVDPVFRTHLDILEKQLAEARHELALTRTELENLRKHYAQLRFRLADRANNLLKRIPFLHRALKR